MKEKSFSARQKNELMAATIKNPCCKRAMLDGILCAKAKIIDNKVSISVENADMAEYISQLINEVFSKDPQINIPKAGGRVRVITFESVSAIKYISKFKEAQGFSEICKQKCTTCHSSFWRGVFLVSGRITNPEKGYLLEFYLDDRADQFKELFAEQDLNPLSIVRKCESLIYFKRKSDIQDFFAISGMNNTVFSLLDSFIKAEMRESANRISNCETHNISRAIDASQRYIAAINDLIESNLISSLPDELAITAKLRVEYPDLTLSQLASISVPSITKSGLSHRLNKILSIAEKKLGKKYV